MRNPILSSPPDRAFEFHRRMVRLLRRMRDMGLKLSQGQIWKQGGVYFCIVRLERLSVEYKEFLDPAERKGAHHTATKKEFCRLIKGAELFPKPQA